MYKFKRLGIVEIVIHSLGIMTGLFIWNILWDYIANGIVIVGLIEHIGFVLWIGFGNILLILMALNVFDMLNKLAWVQQLVRIVNLLLFSTGVLTTIVFLFKNYALLSYTPTGLNLIAMQACFWVFIHLSTTQAWKWEETK